MQFLANNYTSSCSVGLVEYFSFDHFCCITLFCHVIATLFGNLCISLGSAMLGHFLCLYIVLALFYS